MATSAPSSLSLPQQAGNILSTPAPSSISRQATCPLPHPPSSPLSAGNMSASAPSSIPLCQQAGNMSASILSSVRRHARCPLPLHPPSLSVRRQATCPLPLHPPSPSVRRQETCRSTLPLPPSEGRQHVHSHSSSLYLCQKAGNMSASAPSSLSLHPTGNISQGSPIYDIDVRSDVS